MSGLGLAQPVASNEELKQTNMQKSRLFKHQVRIIKRHPPPKTFKKYVKAAINLTINQTRYLKIYIPCAQECFLTHLFGANQHARITRFAQLRR